VTVDLAFGFRARYRTRFTNGLHENEIVYVYFGRLDAPTDPDRREIAALTFVDLAQIANEVRRTPEAYAYWFRHYLERHFEEIARGIARAVDGRPSRLQSPRQR
jgi:isopentenyldiphosphate isomerase